MAMKPNSILVLNYMKEHAGENFTAADVAADLSMDKRQVDGIVTSALCRKGFAERIPAEIELDDGTHKAVKFLRLTDAGMALDPNVSEAE